MSKKKTEKKDKSFIKFPSDTETVIIEGKRFEINQSSPPFELVNRYSAVVYGLQNMDSETNRIYKIIDVYNIKLDEAISNNDINKILELDKLVKEKKQEACDLLLKFINILYDTIEWLLGSEAVAIIKKQANNIETLYPIATEIFKRNIYLNNVIRQSSK